ncbi:tRNA (mnm(5)s(2)U34)-methyltransferase [Neisseria zalophi]|uniref:Methyltransferase domain-containing protein n=1 Tax=Neisseria zalophi TaxID=640030 RepID=A0A5J6PV56_9NEIS|nr:class I SAM-dependent methyltransferase [Neisseria zalophi]QEY26551.1 methyltransferase domain-containing protein [Neisseria zalophi]
MYLTNILPFAHYLLSNAVKPGDTVIDGTAGNGHDTLALAQMVGANGKVWAFDIQAQALAQTAARLDQAGARAQVAYIQAGHERLADYVAEPITAAIFNFGWLPGGDKTLTTQADTSIRALESALHLLKSGGLLAAVLYPGHEAGNREAAAVEQWAALLPQQQYSVLKYGFINRRNQPPYLLAAEKLK